MEYASIIDRIMEAERTADKITDEVQKEQEGLNQRLEAEGRRIRENLMANAQERLEKLRQEEARRQARALEAQGARLADTSARIEAAYSRYGENWVDTLFRQTVDIP